MGSRKIIVSKRPQGEPSSSFSPQRQQKVKPANKKLMEKYEDSDYSLRERSTTTRSKKI